MKAECVDNGNMECDGSKIEVWKYVDSDKRKRMKCVDCEMKRWWSGREDNEKMWECADRDKERWRRSVLVVKKKKKMLACVNNEEGKMKGHAVSDENNT